MHFELITILKDFVSQSSIHGFSHISNTLSLKVRLFWTCLIIAAAIGTTIHLQSLIRLYLRYEYYDSVGTEELPLTFPDISLCSSEGISDFEMFKNNKMIFQTNILNTFQGMVSNNFSNKKYLDLMNTYWLTSQGYYANIPNGEQHFVGMSLDDFVLHCDFKQKHCSEFGHFIQFMHDQFFNCFTFRHNLTKHPTILPGPENGISLILVGNSIVNGFYNPANVIGNVNGIKVLIHEQGSYPAVYRNAIDIHPGQSTNIGLIAKQFSRLGRPYENCFDTSRDYYYKGTGYIFSEEFCEQMKMGSEIYEKCNCVSTSYPGDYPQTTFMNNCLYLNDKNMSESFLNKNCERKITEEFQKDKSSSCDWPCEQVDYETRVSQTEWPIEIMIPNFVSRYLDGLPIDNSIRWTFDKMKCLYESEYERCNHTNFKSSVKKVVRRETLLESMMNFSKGVPTDLGLLFNATVDPDIDPSLKKQTSFEDALKKWVHKNFYRLNIFFKQRKTEVHRQMVTFSLVDLFSAVGGVLGLWLGFSAFSAIEIIILLSKICYSPLKVGHNDSEQKLSDKPKDKPIGTM